MTENRNNRQELFFTKDGQKLLEKKKIGIVGLGGLGSQVAQSLAYLGIQHLTLIDNDKVETTNLNRLPGVFPSDVGKPKVEVINSYLLKINPAIIIIYFISVLQKQKVFDELSNCDVIFGCLDNDNARQILNEFCAIYGITLIDLATEIHKEDNYLNFGGRVIFCTPGEFCLHCIQEIDYDQASLERLNDEYQKKTIDHGYGLGPNGPAPAVISLNGVVANLAVTEFFKFLLNIGEHPRYLIYKAHRGLITRNTDKKLEDCFVCGYLAKEKPKDHLLQYR